ncbi:SagB family peptide dehydrogenase [Streptomyces sp. NPDC096319]|uniref:SagB/ThcOx family dehydrogenase n=1 Tax=Streptomyces sp. NPDC096319 TaxID=3366084 RepID=UPI003807E0C9
MQTTQTPASVTAPAPRNPAAAGPDAPSAAAVGDARPGTAGGAVPAAPDAPSVTAPDPRNPAAAAPDAPSAAAVGDARPGTPEGAAGEPAPAVPVFTGGVQVLFADEGDAATLAGPATSLAVRPVRGGVRTALRRLAEGPLPAEELYEGLLPAERVHLDRILGRAKHLVAHAVFARSGGRRVLVRLEPVARDAAYRPVAVRPDATVRLSRFSFCRSRDGALVLESPLVKYRAVFTDAAARTLAAALGEPGTPGRLGADAGLDAASTADVLGHLVGAGFAELAYGDGAFASDAEPVLRQWDFHDLLFHSRIRSGRYDDVFGAVYPHRGAIEPRPAVRPVPEGPFVPLYRPTREEIAERDPSLTTAIETRRSIRGYGEKEMTARQLGELLYRVARVRAHYTPEPGSTRDEVVSRPYPSGGQGYELELYVTVRRCAGLEPGIYYYDPVGHRLVLRNDEEADRESLFHVASRATGMEARPDVLVTVTARFQRMSWKYRAIAYATTLRHTGVLYQTMYLVATALGLAPCALGNGDADMSARVLGLDYLQESSVGDFLLGSRRPDDSVAGEPGEGWRMVNSPEWSLPENP